MTKTHSAPGQRGVGTWEDFETKHEVAAKGTHCDLVVILKDLRSINQ